METHFVKITHMEKAEFTIETSATRCALVTRLAKRYIWWKQPAEAMRFPQILFAQVMDRGTLEDMDALEDKIGARTLIGVLERAEIGQFRPQSWTYWHYRLGVANEPHDMPAMPIRRLG